VTVLDGEAEGEFREFVRAETSALMRAAAVLASRRHHLEVDHAQGA
jgi:hypothetical protein